MERTELVNPERKVGLPLRILLYLNVSTYRAVAALPSPSDFRRDYHISSFSVLIITVGEFTIFRFLFPNLTQYWQLAILVPMATHGLLSVVFGKKIQIMSSDYNSYYNKPLFFVSFIFLVIGIVGFLMIFNELIGK